MTDDADEPRWTWDDYTLSCAYDTQCPERGECWTHWWVGGKKDAGYRSGWICKAHLAVVEGAGTKLT
jgi:hypothetical protein